MNLDEKVELESRMYDAGYSAGQASIQNKYLEFRNTYIDHLQNLIARAVVKNEWDSVAYARQLLRSLNK